MKIFQKILGAIAAVFLVFLILPADLFAQAMFYVELPPKDNRIYVFNNQEAYQAFMQTGEIEVSITRVHEGPNGETLIFDSEEALHLYNFKHNRPDEVIPHAKAAPPAVQEKLPYKFSGYMFGDYFYNTSRDSNIGTFSNVALPGGKDLNGFQFRRIYFTFDDDLSEQFTARFRLEADQAALSSDGKISVFVKDAYLRWRNAFGQSDFLFGIQPTPAYEITDNVWQFRSLEKTIMDLRGIVPSRDISVTLRGKLDAAGKYNYWVMAGNGSGNRPESDKFKRGYFHFLFRPTERIYLQIYQDIIGRPDITDPNNAAATVGNNAYTTGFFGAYTKPEKYALGFEAFVQNFKNGVKIGSAAPFTLETSHFVGYSGWAWFQFNSKVGVVGRYDFIDPSTNSATKGDSRNFFLASLFFKPIKNVFIMPNVEVETYQKSVTGQSFKKSVTLRITFYYIYL